MYTYICIYNIYIYTYIYIYIYVFIYMINQPFRSLRAHQHSSDQRKILKDHSVQTTARVVSLAYCLWLPFLIDRVLNLTKSDSSNRFAANIYSIVFCKIFLFSDVLFFESPYRKMFARAVLKRTKEKLWQHKR